MVYDFVQGKHSNAEFGAMEHLLQLLEGRREAENSEGTARKKRAGRQEIFEYRIWFKGLMLKGWVLWDLG